MVVVCAFLNTWAVSNPNAIKKNLTSIGPPYLKCEINVLSVLIGSSLKDDQMKKRMMCVQAVVAILALSVIACSGCDKEEKAPAKWSVDRSAKPTSPAASKESPKATPEVVKGSALNAVFLAKDYAGLTRVFTTEKAGFSQADYKKGDDAQFTLSVTDLKDKPDLRAKYADVEDKLEGHPYKKRGKGGSMVLVSDRFQVKLTSKSMDEATRKTHLSKLNFTALPK